MTERLIDYDPLSGVATYHAYDAESDTTLIRTEQDAEAILERNKRLAGEGAPTGDFWRAASIPNGLIHKWLVEEGVDVFNRDHWPAVRRKLNSSEYRWLRTAEFVL